MRERDAEALGVIIVVIIMMFFVFLFIRSIVCGSTNMSDYCEIKYGDNYSFEYVDIEGIGNVKCCIDMDEDCNISKKCFDWNDYDKICRGAKFWSLSEWWDVCEK